LKEFDITTRKYIATYVPGDIDSSITITTNAVEEYNDSTLLVTTIYHGLYLFNKRSKVFSVPPNIYLPPNTSTWAIHEDSLGNYWMTTNFSLYKFSHDLTNQVVFHMDHSILQEALGSIWFVEMSDGRWMTSSTSEVICFDPLRLHLSPGSAARVEISGFKVFDEQINIDSILNVQHSIVLPYDHNFLTIEFAALDYSGPKQTNYYYRLSDIDKTWNYTTTKQFADYTDLKPGEYNFEVKTSETDDTALITSIPIVIKPPWWGTFWFRLLAVLSIGSFVYFLLRRRIQTIRNEADLKHQIAETEMMALRSQMNPHFIFNCINSIDAMIQSNDKYRATLYLNKFAKLIRNVLESSKQKTVPLSKDLDTLQLYLDLEKIRHPDTFTSTILIDPIILEEDYKVPPLIIQPYVENAILHGLIHRSDKAGTLEIGITRDRNHLVYVIEDNGVGRKHVNGEWRKHEKRFGMQISSDRVRLFNDEEVASVQVKDLEMNGQPTGTRITIHLKTT
ncbi:MAG: histidine kinase, partial [Bacteroidota bacterium]|nr:histidine kinase [Bacteroidota bacterium]